MSLESFLIQADTQVDMLRAGLPGKVSELDSTVNSLFQYASLVEVEAAFYKTINTGETPNSATNDVVTKAYQTVREELAAAVSNLRAFARWITLHIPPVEDGNNFGVGVQHEVLKGVKDQQGMLQGLFNALPGYYKDRAAAWKGLDLGSKVTTKSSSGSSTESDGKEDPSTKKSSSNETVSMTTNPSVSADGIAHVVSLDVQTYFHLKCALEDVRDVYVAIADCIFKNLSKIQHPKGKSGSMNSAMSMY